MTKNGQTVSSYVYDESGLRLKKQGTTESTYYAFDTGGNVLYEQENQDYLEYVYVLGKHFARVDGNLDNLSETTKYFYHTDHLGSTVLVTDQAGQQVWNAEYTPFGKQTAADGELDHVTQFTGKDLDSDSGLYYFNARWMDSEMGRFISEDPGNDPNNFNLYIYCRNNPLILADPSGLYVERGDVNIEKKQEIYTSKETVKIGTYGTITKGDTLAQIAKDAYGDEKLAPLIANVNGIEDPNKIREGQTLYLPEIIPLKTENGTVDTYERIDPSSLSEAISKKSVIERNVTLEQNDCAWVAAPKTYQNSGLDLTPGNRNDILGWDQDFPFKYLNREAEASWNSGAYINPSILEYKSKVFNAELVSGDAGVRWALPGYKQSNGSGKLDTGAGVKLSSEIDLFKGSLRIPLGMFDLSVSGQYGLGGKLQIGYVPGSDSFFTASVAVGPGLGIGLAPPSK